MFPNLSYAFNYFFGTPVDNFLSIFQTFGLFLVLAFLGSAYTLLLEFRRKRKLGLFEGREIQEVIGEKVKLPEIIGNGIFGLILGLKLPLIISDSVAFSQDPAGLLFSSKGNWFIGILGALGLAGVSYYLGNKKALDKPEVKTKMQYPEHRIPEITMVAAFFGVLGSKLFSVFENWESFIQAPIQQLVSGSGLTIYGGLLLAFVAVYFFVKKIGIKPIHMMDAVAPSLIIGYLIGRMGCQFSGDGDWGIANTSPKPDWFIFPDWAWSFDYPHNVVNSLVEGVKMENCGGLTSVSGAEPIYCTVLQTPVFPTPLYEIFACVIIFAILWFFRNKFKNAGVLFFLYVLLNGVERFFIEQIRVNPRYDLLNLNWSLSQWIAFALILTGIVGMFYLLKYGTVKTNNVSIVSD